MIETTDLSRRFGSLTAVDRVSFRAGKGEIFGLLGPNGAGKSTTLSMLCTILKPSSGSAKVNGYDVVREAGKVRKSIGIVFQDPSIDDKLTARENLEVHADLYDVPRQVMHDRIDEVLQLVELEERENDNVATFSGGMRRRLELARSLIHYPRVLFLDEPTIGLDPQSRNHVWNYIRELKKREEITIVLTTHYMEEADKLCDRIAIIDRGRIVALDTPRGLKSRLEGEMIVIVSSDNDLLVRMLAGTGTADEITRSDGALSLSVRNAMTALPRVLELAGTNSIRIESIALRQVDMDDVFMHYTGRALRDGKGSELTGMEAIMRRRIR